MSSLADLIKAKIKADGTSATALARSVDLSLPSFRAILAGKSAPNARSAKKYAKLLGISEEAVLGGKKAKPAKVAKAAKGKPGPKPGKKAKPGPKPGKKAKPGPKPGKKGKPGRKPAVVSPRLAKLAQQAVAAKPLLKDKLALAVHGLSKANRAIVKVIVKTLK